LAQIDDVMHEVEALLFATDEPLTSEKLLRLVEMAGGEEDLILDAIDLLNEHYSANNRIFRIVSVGGGWKFATIPSMAPVIGRLFTSRKKTRLSRQAMEALAIIAFKQPVTRAEIEAIRGVDSLGVLRTLFDRELIKVTGRADRIGRPLLYKTTNKFLQYLGLESIESLPKPGELGAADHEPVKLEVPGDVESEEWDGQIGTDE